MLQENKPYLNQFHLSWKSDNSKSANYSYRFGFNSKEKDNEIYGEGNAYDFEARMLDVRLGKWMSIDPKAGQYPWVSPYVAFANDPLIYIDPGGETLKLGGNIEQAKCDIYSLVPIEYYPMIQISDAGVVSINLEDIPTGVAVYGNNGDFADVGFTLLNNLVNANESYMYVVSDDIVTYDTKYGTNKRSLNNDDTHVINESTTKREPYSKSEESSLRKNGMKLVGYDSFVAIDGDYTFMEGNGIIKPRSAVVFHELWEAWERTSNSLPYDYPQYDENGNTLYPGGNFMKEPVWDDTRLGAHDMAIKMEEGFHERSVNPGQIEKDK